MPRTGFRLQLAPFAALVLTVPAWAAELPSVDDPASGNIIVTARRAKEDLQKIPVAETVITSDRIKPLAINTPLDLNKIAGLGGVPIGSLTNVNFTIRGQGTAFGGQPGVISYFAEVPGFPLTYYDLDNIQVIKGPQGTLFGENSTGGVVLFEPKRPTSKLEGYLETEGGNHGYWQVEGALNVPVVSDSLLVRLSFQIRDRNGWATGIYADGRKPRDLNNLDNGLFRVSTIWRPTSRLENYLVYSQDHIQNNGTATPLYYYDPRFMNPAVRNLVPASVPSIAAAWQFWSGYAPPPGKTFSQLLADAFARQVAAGPLTMFTDFSQRNTIINRGFVDHTTWQITDDIRIRNIFGLRWSTQQGATYDQDATDLVLLDYQCRFKPGATSPSSPCAKFGGWPSRTLTDELQIQGHSLGNRLTWQVGGFYLQGGVRKFQEDTKPFIVFGSLSGDPASAAFCASVAVAAPCASMSKTDTHSYAVYGHLSYEILRGVHLSGGYRETWDYTRTDTTGKSSYRVPFNGQLITMPIYGGSPAPGAGIVSTVVNLPANGSYDVSADWQVRKDVLLYVAHRSGYKPGGINATANPGTPQRTFGPERVKDFEVGAKTQWTLFGVRGQINADFFHTWYSNIQEGEIIPGTAQTVTTNLANARIDGVEIEGGIYPSNWFRLTGNLAYTDARYSDWLEHSTCGAQYWRPQCAGLPTSTAITINHSGGNLTVNGQTISFKPDRFANASKWQWAVQPAMMLKPWIGEDVTIAANIYHRGPYDDATAVANTSKIAGVPMTPETTVFGNVTTNPYDAPGYTLVDLRVDWTNALGSRISMAAGVTNLANKIYRVSSASAFEIIGDVYTLIGEPRMWYVAAKYNF